MKKIDFDKIRKLPPQAKIKVLKEIEGDLRELIESRKKEIADKNKEIESAEDLLREAEEENRVLEEIQTPEVKPIEIDKLFHKEESLEKITQESQIKEQEQRIEELRNTPVKELYNAVKTIENEVRETGIETVYQQNRIEEIQKGVYLKKQDAEQKTYVMGKEEEEFMTNIEKKIKGIYR